MEGAQSIGATVAQDAGLEADDIAGILSKTCQGDVLLYSSDSDWGQLVNDRVRVKSILTGEFMPAKDIRLKWIGGDRGDNIPGCSKRLKSGAISAKGWGQQGALKLLEDPTWESQIGPDELERNKVLVTLPCPLWDLEQAETALRSCAVQYVQTDEHWAKYGVTAQVREVLKSGAQREAWIEKLRSHLLVKTAEVAG